MIHMILVVAAVGVVAWLVTQLPMPQPFRNLVVGLMLIAVIFWVLYALGGTFPFQKLMIR